MPDFPTTPQARRKVFGIGWAKTGTTTLGRCLQILGYDHQSQNLSLVPRLMRGEWTRVMEIAAARESFEDWPWLVIYRELDRAFPGSRFILTCRDPHDWLESYRAMLAREGAASEDMNRIRSWLYGLPFPEVTETALLARFNRHQEDVLSYFADRPADLLVVDWARGDGWPALCQFLESPTPAVPFPHLNRRPSS